MENTTIPTMAGCCLQRYGSFWNTILLWNIDETNDDTPLKQPFDWKNERLKGCLLFFAVVVLARFSNIIGNHRSSCNFWECWSVKYLAVRMDYVYICGETWAMILECSSTLQFDLLVLCWLEKSSKDQWRFGFNWGDLNLAINFEIAPPHMIPVSRRLMITTNVVHTTTIPRWPNVTIWWVQEPEFERGVVIGFTYHDLCVSLYTHTYIYI